MFFFLLCPFRGIRAVRPCQILHHTQIGLEHHIGVFIHFPEHPEIFRHPFKGRLQLAPLLPRQEIQNLTEAFVRPAFLGQPGFPFLIQSAYLQYGGLFSFHAFFQLHHIIIGSGRKLPFFYGNQSLKHIVQFQNYLLKFHHPPSLLCL